MYRRQILGILHILDGMQMSEAYWHMGSLVTQLHEVQETATKFLDAGDAETALTILLTLKEEQALCRPWLDQEIALVNPRLILPIGRLAIGLFFDTRLPLEKIIGMQIEQDGRVIIPLPHPSGASTWYNKPENRARVKKAIRLIRKQRETLGL